MTEIPRRLELQAEIDYRIFLLNEMRREVQAEGKRLTSLDHLIDAATGLDEARLAEAKEIIAEVIADAIEGERANLAAGFPPSRWRCICGTEHSRGHFGSIGVHRCLACGYTGTGGVMLDDCGGDGGCCG